MLTMKIVIFGATGETGRQLVEQVLAARHEVVTYVRDPSKLGISKLPWAFVLIFEHFP